MQVIVQKPILPNILSQMPNNQRLSALEKALAVLEAVADQPQAVGLPDLAARLNLPRQTVHRVLGQLEDTGLVLRDPSRERYSIGPRQSRLALATLCSKNQLILLRVILQRLVDELKETCNIGVLDGLDYVYLARIESKWPLRAHLDAGSRIAAHAVSGGKMMLAHLDPERCKRLLRSRKLDANTAKTITRVADVEAELVRVRARGFAVSNEEFLDGIIGVAVPIKDASGRPLAALTMQGPVTRISLKACEAQVPRLMRTAERLARAWID
jgi:DNA-binding IclR family transcriptional regulator